ncbi:hypothetical protein H1Q78_19650 [Cellulosimicrobium cellulans]|uniref:hypothetical protein n=1 Tax=Cellulosimicrobium cellulans TaxID=1710 RepID=UPI001EDA78A5|nr:hypothetical protein [Cellulosimicrobium cellulans]UKJ63777.1 hypothetical protein H1Q78_19650 [Cellulosimicrobium cellulans]
MEFLTSVLLSLQRALWDVVTPNLRGVAVRADHPRIAARFLFENDPSEDDRENVSLAETYTTADFPSEVEVDFSPVRVPVAEPRDLCPGESWVYLRKEAPVAGPLSIIQIGQVARLQRILDGPGAHEGPSEVHVLRDILVGTLSTGQALVDHLEERRRSDDVPEDDMVDEIGVYSYASDVLGKALETALADPDDASRARGLREVGETLESALRTGHPHTRDAIDIRIVEGLIAYPERWIALRPYADDELRERVRDRLQYFSWDEDTYGPVFGTGERR